MSPKEEEEAKKAQTSAPQAAARLPKVSKSKMIALLNLLHLYGNLFPAVLIVAVAFLASRFVDIFKALDIVMQNNQVSQVVIDRALLLSLGKASALLLGLALVVFYVYTRDRGVYLIDFATFEPPESWKFSVQEGMQYFREHCQFSEESLQFLEKMLTQSGVGLKTAWPPGLLKFLKGEPNDETIESSRVEAEVILYDTVRNALKKAGVQPREVDFLVVNCSLFSPTPSLCSMIINEFKMREQTRTYNLSGMGCSAGLISIELANNLLQAHPNKICLVVSTEIITPNIYKGNEKSFLLQNVLFRCGGAAVVLSNKWSDSFRAKFKLLACLRTQLISEESYACVFETEDQLKNRGVRLSKDIVKVAGKALEKNLTILAPSVLPPSEQLKVVASIGFRSLSKALLGLGIKLPKTAPYVPDFKRGLDHFCIHAGGRGVIDGIEKNLKLMPENVEASRQTLHTYGNTSSSSIWYELQYLRSKKRVKSGQRVIQLAFGSGFKCNSAVWLALTNSAQERE